MAYLALAQGGRILLAGSAGALLLASAVPDVPGQIIATTRLVTAIEGSTALVGRVAGNATLIGNAVGRSEAVGRVVGETELVNGISTRLEP